MCWQFDCCITTEVIRCYNDIFIPSGCSYATKCGRNIKFHYKWLSFEIFTLNLISNGWLTIDPLCPFLFELYYICRSSGVDGWVYYFGQAGHTCTHVLIHYRPRNSINIVCSPAHYRWRYNVDNITMSGLNCDSCIFFVAAHDKIICLLQFTASISYCTESC